MAEWNLFGLFRKTANKPESGGSTVPKRDDRVQCPCCKRYEHKKHLVKDLLVCSSCGYHFKISSRKRLELLADKNSFREMFSEINSKNFLNFPDYEEKLKRAAAASREREAVICGTASFGGEVCAVFVMDPFFMMGSMGSAVGERIARTFEYAAEHGLPVVGFTVSGGARMQEGILSLMQMAKISGAVQRHSEAGGLYTAVLTNPTTGGVTASFAMLGDIILAEPKAVVGFAGRRVIEQTTKEALAADFQSAEFVRDHGFIDAIVPRKELKTVLNRLLRQHSIGKERA